MVNNLVSDIILNRVNYNFWCEKHICSQTGLRWNLLVTNLIFMINENLKIKLLLSRGWVAQYIQVNKENSSRTDNLVLHVQTEHSISSPYIYKTECLFRDFRGEKSHMCDFMTENFPLQALQLPCFFAASMLQFVKSHVVWKRNACVLWRGCWILGGETFQMKGDIRPFPGASNHAQLAPSGVQYGVVKVLTLKNITYSKKIHL